MTHILLTGAGFSRNWGGWLANEAFEELLGCPEVDAQLRRHLWQSKNKGGGFEDALGALQTSYVNIRDANTKKLVENLQAALVGMFNRMNQAFDSTSFEFQNHTAYLVRTFLTKFDAIFTLNQDLLLEHHYLDDNIQLSGGGKWNGWQIPGTKLLDPSPHIQSPSLQRSALRVPEKSSFNEESRLQPYYKLHGSSNWVSDSGDKLLVMGSNKEAAIRQHEVLKWYDQKFTEYLARPNLRLMVIGYSFSDGHINRAITQAAANGNLKLFIIDPMGVDVLYKQKPWVAIMGFEQLVESLSPYIIGASRRPLHATFNSDRVEHAKIMRFFE